jgi:hypothetical protein
MTDTLNTPAFEKPELSRDDHALDAVLQQVKPHSDPQREADLLDRIMAAADKTPRIVAVATPSVAPVGPAAVRSGDAQRTVLPLRQRRTGNDLWRAAGLLAASLVVGVFLGQSPFGAHTARRIEQATGFVLASASQAAALSLASAELEDDD